MLVTWCVTSRAWRSCLRLYFNKRWELDRFVVFRARCCPIQGPVARPEWGRRDHPPKLAKIFTDALHQFSTVKKTSLTPRAKFLAALLPGTWSVRDPRCWAPPPPPGGKLRPHYQELTTRRFAQSTPFLLRQCTKWAECEVSVSDDKYKRCYWNANLKQVL